MLTGPPCQPPTLFNAGLKLDRSEEELAAYDEVVTRFGDDPAPAIREVFAKAMLNRGVALGELDRSKEAVAGGVLHLRAERRQEEQAETKSYRRRELRYGSFSRGIPLPEGVSDNDIKATYKDGILEVRVPLPAETKKESRRVPVTQG